MAIGLLGIATGAAKVAGKIFKGVQKRREAKVEKRVQALFDAQEKKAQIDSLFRTPPIVATDKVDSIKKPSFISSLGSLIDPGAGTQAISGAANTLQDVKGGVMNLTPISGAQAIAESSRSNNDVNRVNPMLLIGGAVLVAILFLMKRR